MTKLDKTNILIALEEGGYYFPKEFIFTRRDWEDLHETLSSFQKRVLERRLSSEQAVKADGLKQCPFCDKFDVVDDMGHCTSCGKLTRPPAA